jgi:signal transduction histidine kinase
MRLSIKKRIWGSFAFLIFLFVLSGIMTAVTLNKSKILSEQITEGIDPVQTHLEDLRDIILESKMYTTNWVFLRSNEEDKAALRRLHTTHYPQTRQKIEALLPALNNKNLGNIVARVFEGFDALLDVENRVMSTLSKFEDYDDLIKKMGAEQIIEDEVIPQTSAILSRLDQAVALAGTIKDEQYNTLETYSLHIRAFITLMSIMVIVLGIVLSVYFSRVITHPLGKIQRIVADLGMGIINKVDHSENDDEIGAMVSSVNSLSAKLNETARFAQAVGNHNFDLNFAPLSEHDILGKALLTMRDNIRTSEDSLVKTSSNLMKRNQALEQYTFIVSHNLRAPIATIMGLTELLNSLELSREEQKQMIGGLEVSAHKLDQVIHDLNHIIQIRQQVHELVEHVSLTDTINEIKLSFSRLIEKGDINFKCDFSGVGFLTTIKTYLVSILYNLISNSIKYRRQDIPLSIEVKSYREGNEIVILFRDNGKGIDMEKNGQKLFRLYERFDLTVEGKGMGLFMIKTQVENLDGNITVESEIDKGTTFRITLPDHRLGHSRMKVQS